MRCRFLIVATVVLAAALRSTAVVAAPPPPVGQGASASEQPKVVEVDDLMKAPDKYQGAIRVRGMVRKVFANEKRLALLDSHFANCCSTPCDSEKLLPVAWTGEMPRLRAMVVFSGEIQSREGKFEFVGKTIEIEPPGKGLK